MQSAFEILNNHYDHIYVLTLKRAVERQLQISESLKGIDFSFFYGMDKQEFEIADLEKKRIYNPQLAMQRHRYHKPMSGGQIGCSWSHRNIYADMLEKGYNRVLIFEDDCLPNPHAIHLVPEVLAQLPADWELLYWGYGKQEYASFRTWLKQKWYHIQHRLGGLKWSHTMINHLYPRKISPNISRAGFHDYTYAYAITRPGAEKLMQMQTPIQFVADNLLAWACTGGLVQGYIATPKIFLHDDLPSGQARTSFIQE